MRLFRLLVYIVQTSCQSIIIFSIVKFAENYVIIYTIMRLKDNEINSIKNTAVKYFGKNSKVYLFGSRTDDRKKGGDIDIFIETLNNIDIIKAKIKFLVELEKEIGERKIDLIVKNLNSKKDLPIYDIIKRQGILIR